MIVNNLTPHSIVLRGTDGLETTVMPSGQVARVASVPGRPIGQAGGVPVFAAPTWGAVEGLPAPVADTLYLVSALVAARCTGRKDVVSPGTGPQDGAIRDERGQVVAVTRLIQAPQEV
jgi:hypothetical protein